MTLSKTTIKYIVMTLLTIVSLSYLLFNSSRLEENVMDGILDINIDVVQDSILLNVKLDRSMTCDEVIEKLNIIELPFKNKMYKPLCEMVDNNLVKISYKSAVST